MTETKHRIVAVIPAYNEENRIAKVISSTKPFVDEIIVVNDFSADKTSEVASTCGVKVVDLELNQGAGYATRLGCDLAIDMHADIIVTLDADGQHDPKDIPLLLTTLIEENLDIVFGYRPRNEKMPLVNKIGGLLLYRWSQFLFGVKIEDTQTGFHAFSKKCYPKLRWHTKRYGFVSEFVYRVSVNKLSYKEVEVKTIYVGKESGMRKRDGIYSGFLMLIWKMGWTI